jgi:indole-3-glycerol phosphate synthase
MLGVNNRNLGTFHTDVENSFRLAKAMQTVARERNLSPLLVSESGISTTTTVSNLREAGFHGFLIGETFMKTDVPGDTLAQFIKGLS